MTSVRDSGEVEFRFFRAGAAQVSVAGDFNGWQDGLPMMPQGDGWWKTSAKLQPGEYRFRYLVDGRWFTDFASHGVERCEQEWNSVLYVPKAQKCRNVDMKSKDAA